MTKIQIPVTQAHIDEAKRRQPLHTYEVCSECVVALAAADHFKESVRAGWKTLRCGNKLFSLDHRTQEKVVKFDNKRPVTPWVITATLDQDTL